MILIGKECGTYKEHDYFRLYFVSDVRKGDGEGLRPLTVKCTRDVYNAVSVDSAYDHNDLYYDRYGKIVAIR